MNINEQFYLDHTDNIKYLLRKKHSDVQGVLLEDLTQEVFSAAIKYKDSYNETRGSVQTWLGLIVTHVWDRYLRGSDVMNLIDTDVDYSDDNTEAMLVSQEEVLEEPNHWYLHNKDQADHYLDMLPELQKEKLYMFLVLGFSHREIARTIGITEQSSRTLISIAVRNLKKLVNAEEPNKVKLTPFVPNRGTRMYSGDWSFRPGEGIDRSPGIVYQYNEEEIEQFCRERNLSTSKRN